jgi:hypothetical protein
MYYSEIGKQLLLVMKSNEGKCFVVIICIWVELAYIEDFMFAVVRVVFMPHSNSMCFIAILYY